MTKNYWLLIKIKCLRIGPEKRHVFRWRLKVSSEQQTDCVEFSRLFHALGAATENALLPM